MGRRFRQTNGSLVIAVRNHGFGRANAGETVKRLFGDIGSAGGHRNMSKAVVPLRNGASVKGRAAIRKLSRGYVNFLPMALLATMRCLNRARRATAMPDTARRCHARGRL